MSTLLKDLYSPAFYDHLANVLLKIVPGFNKQEFITAVFDQNFPGLELKGRMKHTSAVLHRFMPADFTATVRLLKAVIAQLRAEKSGEDALVFMFLPDYIETYGIDHFEASADALEYITTFVSCEFGVRPFLLKYTGPMLSRMTVWSQHENYKVRRLASEGSRPRLPWAMAIPALKKDPAPILPLLENLMNDPHEWVRRSVANSLNDIAKSHPEIVIGMARKWQGTSKETDAIIKHGSRTLLKQGHPAILEHYQLQSAALTFSNFQLLTPEVKAGDSLSFRFTVQNDDPGPQTVRLEYAIYYLLKNGRLSRKVFKISERPYAAGRLVTVARQQSFKQITTKIFYPGRHGVAIIINGAEKELHYFTLTPADANG